MQNQFSELRDAYFSDPKEIENLHSLRVFLRKILSIEVVQRQENTDLQSLTELIKLSNPLRDLDVFEDQCVAELFEDQEVRQKMGAAVERHRQRYLSEFESALRAFSPQSIPSTVSENGSGESGSDKIVAAERGGERAVSPCRMALFHKLFKKLIKQVLKEPHSDAALHKLRLKIKKMRYDLEHCLEQRKEQDKRHLKLLKRLRRLQTLLGDINDRRQWRKWLKRLRDEIGEEIYERGMLNLKQQSKFLRHALFVKLSKYASASVKKVS